MEGAEPPEQRASSSGNRRSYPFCSANHCFSCSALARAISFSSAPAARRGGQLRRVQRLDRRALAEQQPNGAPLLRAAARSVASAGAIVEAERASTGDHGSSAARRRAQQPTTSGVAQRSHRVQREAEAAAPAGLEARKSAHAASRQRRRPRTRERRRRSRWRCGAQARPAAPTRRSRGRAREVGVARAEEAQLFGRKHAVYCAEKHSAGEN